MVDKAARERGEPAPELWFDVTRHSAIDATELCGHIGLCSKESSPSPLERDWSQKHGL